MQIKIKQFVKVCALMAITPQLGATISLEKINSLATGLGEASAEISSYDKDSQKLFVINSDFASFSIFDFSDPAQASASTQVDISAFGAGPNSIASFDGLVAVAVEADTVTDSGTIEFFDVDGVHQATISVGS